MKLFNTFNLVEINECRECFGSELPCELLTYYVGDARVFDETTRVSLTVTPKKLISHFVIIFLHCTCLKKRISAIF